MLTIEQKFVPRTNFSSVGIQSQVVIGEFAGIKAIRKVAGSELTENEKEEIVLAMKTYKEQLQSLGVGVPMGFYVENTPDGIETVDELVHGEDLDIQLKKGVGIEEWEKVINTLCDLNTGENRCKVMIDAKPANWIVNSKPYFIDFFPPTLRDENGNLHPFIERLYKRSRNLFNFNYGDTRGQITKLLAGAKMTYPDRYQELKKATLSIVQDRLPFSLSNYICEQVQRDFPDMNSFYSKQGAEERLRELNG